MLLEQLTAPAATVERATAEAPVLLRGHGGSHCASQRPDELQEKVAPARDAGRAHAAPSPAIATVAASERRLGGLS